MPAVSNPDRTVVARSRGPAANAPFRSLRAFRSNGSIGPLALRVRHEADAIDAVRLIKSGRGYAVVVSAKLDVERHVNERIAVFGAEGGSEQSPFLDLGILHSLIAPLVSPETK